MANLLPQNPRVSKKTIVAWIVYDIGNTVFFVGVMGLVFPLWITTVMGGNDATVAFTLAAAMAIVFFVAPLLGSLSDQSGKRMIFLVFFTLLAVLSTLAIGFPSLGLSLVLFATAVMAIHTADIFYNTLLEEVSSSNNRGTIAGVGIGLGYIGAIIAVLISILFVESLGHVFVMRVLGVMILILTCPLLVAGRDKLNPQGSGSTSLKALGYATVMKLFKAVKTVRDEPNWARFLAARFWYMWAVNASASFAVLYGVQTVGLSQQQVQMVLLLGIIAGIPSGALWGTIVDKHGASKVLKTSVGGWLILLAIAALIPILGLPPATWTIVAILTGVCIAGLYVAERPFILEIAPPGRTAEYFGLTSMSGRLAAIAAPFSWGFIVVTLGLGQLIAVLWLTVCVLVSILLLAGLKTGLRSND